MEAITIPLPPLTPTPATEHPSQTETHLPEVTTEMLVIGNHTDNGDFAALIGGIVCVVLLLLIVALAVLLWCLSRHKGSYVTNETDGYGDDEDEDDDESVRSDTALQSKEPLQIKEEE
ncbi:glycophorin-C-like [Thunnus albacares]|uniref:glycophorin-C-like n=1 Tax=Thunnus albacares TaxID=8236 RepID=UPI001CF6A456|nr:glycophorin-C-like [Thunnus albacares]|eukprot:superscaffoldBa00004365_g18762